MPYPETTLAASHHEYRHDLVSAELKKKGNEKFPTISDKIRELSEYMELNSQQNRNNVAELLAADPLSLRVQIPASLHCVTNKAFNPEHHRMWRDISKGRRRNEYAGGGGYREADPILSLRGLGKELWANEDADAYVERLREGWG